MEYHISYNSAFAECYLVEHTHKRFRIKNIYRIHKCLLQGLNYLKCFFNAAVLTFNKTNANPTSVLVGVVGFNAYLNKMDTMA